MPNLNGSHIATRRGTHESLARNGQCHPYDGSVADGFDLLGARLARPCRLLTRVMRRRKCGCDDYSIHQGGQHRATAESSSRNADTA